MKGKTLALILIATVCCVDAQSNEQIHTRAVIFPDIPGFLTLKTDLHIHTVFSDGNVWPSIRVEEAIRDSLDIIAITDHIEYLPHEDDIPPVDRNRSYDVAMETANGTGLLIVKAVELTRDLPPGHSNALFLEDANRFVLEDPIEQFEEAKRQGAFVYWNHPSWEGQQSNTIATLTDMHSQLISDGLLHGIEVVNGDMYSEHALEIALENDLTILGVSDVHGLIDWDYDIEHGGHRPVTLAFTTDKSIAALKDALTDKRTVAYYKDFIIGREKFVMPLLTAIIEVTNAHYIEGTELLNVTLKNHSSANLILANQSGFGLHTDSDIILVPHLSEHVIKVQTGVKMESLTLQFQVLNAIIAPKTHPVLVVPINVD